MSEDSDTTFVESLGLPATEARKRRAALSPRTHEPWDARMDEDDVHFAITRAAVKEERHRQEERESGLKLNGEGDPIETLGPEGLVPVDVQEGRGILGRPVYVRRYLRRSELGRPFAVRSHVRQTTTTVEPTLPLAAAEQRAVRMGDTSVRFPEGTSGPTAEKRRRRGDEGAPPR